MSERRKVKFNDLQEVESDVQELLRLGYTSVGKWDLSQTCRHLNDWMRFPMDGFPKPPFLLRVLLGLMRTFVGNSMLKKTLDQGFPEGGPTMPQTVYDDSEVEDQEAVAQLKQTMDRFRDHEKSLAPSPLYGQLDRETALQLQLRHCEHHLSFLIPKQ